MEVRLVTIQDSVSSHPLAVMETERIGFQDKLKRMEKEMDEELARSVEEHQEKMNRFEREAQEWIIEQREALEEERTKINVLREALENDINAFIQKNGVGMPTFLSTSTESLDMKKKSYKWKKF